MLTAAALATVVALSGCAATTQADAGQDSGAGYVAGDGSLATWEPQQRDGAIDLVGQTYDGDQVDLSQWRGEVVVVNFWYAACPPCRAEAGDLRAIHESAQEAAALGDFENKPLVVLTAGIGHDAEESAEQQALATLSANGVHRIVEGTGHAGTVLDAQGAAATSRAILDVVSSIRAGDPLPE